MTVKIMNEKTNALQNPELIDDNLAENLFASAKWL